MTALTNEIQALQKRLNALEELFEVSKRDSQAVGNKLDQIDCRGNRI